MHEAVLAAGLMVAIAVLIAGRMVAKAIDRAERSRDARLRTFAQHSHAGARKRAIHEQ